MRVELYVELVVKVFLPLFFRAAAPLRKVDKFGLELCEVPEIWQLERIESLTGVEAAVGVIEALL